MPYEVRLAPQVERALRKERDRNLLGRLVSAIGGLATSPRPSGCRKLDGNDGLGRIRVGDHRIIYTIDDGALIILVITVGNRREVYR